MNRNLLMGAILSLALPFTAMAQGSTTGSSGTESSPKAEVTAPATKAETGAKEAKSSKSSKGAKKSTKSAQPRKAKPVTESSSHGAEKPMVR
jgi:hypothetical protein